MILQRLLIIASLSLLISCAGQTGKTGDPIAQSYQEQLRQIKIGKTTPSQLKQIFPDASLKEKGHNYEVWEVAKSGDMDAGAFILWGQMAYDKDQSLLFRFENGVLKSYKSAVTN